MSPKLSWDASHTSLFLEGNIQEVGEVPTFSMTSPFKHRLPLVIPKDREMQGTHPLGVKFPCNIGTDKDWKTHCSKYHHLLLWPCFVRTTTIILCLIINFNRGNQDILCFCSSYTANLNMSTCSLTETSSCTLLISNNSYGNQKDHIQDLKVEIIEAN